MTAHRQPSQRPIPRLALAAALGLAAGAAGAADLPFPGGVDPPSLMLRARVKTGSLKSVLILYPQNYPEFVVDESALQLLGKALFWDQQLGSDGQACASCHFHAGADSRSRNQINPGFRNQSSAFPGGDNTFGNGPIASAPGPGFRANYQLSLTDFPLHRLDDPAHSGSTVLSDTNDVVSSQGSFGADLVALGLPGDFGHAVLGGPFDVGGARVRLVAPRNTPSAINAVFNRRNFWDSRAREEFNGVDPIGALDPGAQLVSTVAGVAQLATVRIPLSSAASQAVGPPLSNVEMSFAGRRFAELGRRMLGAQPLATQLVAPDDSLLGPASAQQVAPALPGLTVRYMDLISQAIAPKWWDAAGWRVDLSGPQPVLVQSLETGPDLFTIPEYNFSLYFGLAIAAYERTLRADDSPFDRFVGGDPTAMSTQAQAGLEWFLGVGRCVKCHSGPELTNQGISRLDAARALSADLLDPPDVERMVVGDGAVSVYDAGSYNIGVRPTGEDVGIGATIGPLGLPLSHSRRYQDCIRAGVAAAVAAGTGLTADQAVRQANVDCGVPHIRARPLEALQLLQQAANLLGADLGSGTADASAPLDVVALIAQAQGLLAGPPFELGSPIPSNFQLGNQLAAQARDLILADAGGNAQVLKLVTAATTLLPDPVNPGPDPVNPFGPPLQPDERLAVMGAFKAPGLRNSELTAPYFHNGGQGTLEQVIQFYNRGGDFHDDNSPDADADVAPIGLNPQMISELVAFLQSLTDERVRWERAPFDHPSLDVPHGAAPGLTPTFLAGIPILDTRVQLPAVGAAGSEVPLGTPGTPFANFPDPLWAQLTVGAGDGQRGTPGTALAAPLRVMVTDDAGRPVPGVVVTFEPPAGGAVSPASVTSGADGTASTTATLSADAGVQAFTARGAGLASPPVRFVAQAVVVASTAPPPPQPAASSGGCASGPAAWPALLLAALGLLLRRSTRRRLAPGPTA